MARPTVNVRRKNVTISVSSEARLQKIKESADFSTDADAIRAALKAYEDIMSAQMDGHSVEIVAPDGSRTKYSRLYEPYAMVDSAD